MAKFKKGDAKPAASGIKKLTAAERTLRDADKLLAMALRIAKESKDEAVRLQAMKLWFERKQGRPKESEDSELKEPPMSLEQIRQHIEELTKARQDSGPKPLRPEGISEKSKPICEPTIKAKPEAPKAEQAKNTQEEREVLEDYRWKRPSFLSGPTN
jgi:hypothetical protein